MENQMVWVSSLNPIAKHVCPAIADCLSSLTACLRHGFIADDLSSLTACLRHGFLADDLSSLFTACLRHGFIADDLYSLFTACSPNPLSQTSTYSTWLAVLRTRLHTLCGAREVLWWWAHDHMLCLCIAAEVFASSY